MATATPEPYTITHSPYPAKTTTTTIPLTAHAIPTTITSTSFSDKLLLTISQHGRLAHWLHIPLSSTHSLTSTPFPSTTLSNDDQESELPLLPHPHLTATTILGGTGTPELSLLGQTLATQIASAILTQNPREGRLLVVGLGLDPKMGGREEYAELVGAVLGVL